MRLYSWQAAAGRKINLFYEEAIIAWRYIGLIFGPAVLLNGTSANSEPHQIAILQGLDKITARVSTISMPIGHSVRFGTLEIVVRYCDKKPPEETPESAAFLDIHQARPGEASVPLFKGWMFASSPALSALEHPVYDIWVLDCEDKVQGGDDSLSISSDKATIPASNKSK